MSDYSHMNHIIKSITSNYKSWFTLVISCIIMSYKTSIFYGWIQYILCILWAYIAHRMAHEPIGFFLNRAHIYHHEHTDWISHAIQVCVELCASFGPVILLYYFIDLEKNHYLVDPYIFLLFFIFYTSTHNINYGLLKVNDVHYKHHLDYSVNYGPDICDILFKTKYPHDGVENTDHYIPNILAATLFSYLFKIYYTNSNNKKLLKDIFASIYIGFSGIVGYFTTKKTFMDITKLSTDEIELFVFEISQIKSKLA
mgnify:CR=1 FL=1